MAGAGARQCAPKCARRETPARSSSHRPSGKDLFHQPDIVLFERSQPLVAHLRDDADAAEKVGGDAAHVKNSAVRVHQVDAIVDGKRADIQRTLQFAAGAHLLQGDHRLAKVAVAPLLALVGDHVGLDHHGADHLVGGVVDREDILDDRRAVAEHLALATPSAAVAQRLEEQRMLGQRQQTARGIFAIE
jgi:hypothetical protein